MSEEQQDTFPDDERPRAPHWRKRSFWKTFLIFLVVYAVIRIGITMALDRTDDDAPAAPGSDTATESTEATDATEATGTTSR